MNFPRGRSARLWGEYARIIRELRPLRIVPARGQFSENSSKTSLSPADRPDSTGRNQWDCLPAGYFGAPHFRDRVYLLAYANEEHGQTGMGVEQDWSRPLFAGRDCQGFPVWLQATRQPDRVDDGIPAKTYRDRVGALGNAVVPQIAEWIGHHLVATEARRQERAA